MANAYSQHVAWSAEDGMFVAVCPELGDLMALGPTEEAAVRELKTAIGLVLEDMAAEGEAPPAPIEHASHSGQFRVRLPKTLHARLAVQARREGVSLNTLVVSLLAGGSSRLTVAGLPEDESIVTKP
jgi:predicted RNase H-like HicB family nuclease